MPQTEDEIRRIVAEWIAYAEDDLNAAELLLRGSHVRQAAYHAQQAAEKFIKAALIRHQIKYDVRSHDIYTLRHSLGQVDSSLAKALEDADILSRYATARRYPGGGRPAGAEQSKKAVALARTVGEKVQAALASFLSSPLNGVT
jgi:HEPN domain-containing protein